MTGELMWFEMGMPDAARAQSFYRALLGWTFETMGEGGAVISTAQGRAGLHAGDDARQIVTDFEVEDIEAAAHHVRELGGRVDDPGPAERASAGSSRATTTKELPSGSTYGVDQQAADVRWDVSRARPSLIAP